LESLRAIEINQINQVNQKISQQSYADLVDIYGEVVYKFCRSLTYSKEDADDLFQETFMRVFQQLPLKVIVKDNPQGFLFSTALYLWKSWKRKYARRNRIAPTEPLDDQAISDTDIEGNFVQQEDMRIVRELVDVLPEKYKVAVILFYTMELGVSDIAKVLKLPAGTVKSRLHKARKLIEKGLLKNGY
jgi:RNA polymerase sigma-70 factor (ECF subfamily)